MEIDDLVTALDEYRRAKQDRLSLVMGPFGQNAGALGPHLHDADQWLQQARAALQTALDEYIRERVQAMLAARLHD